MDPSFHDQAEQAAVLVQATWQAAGSGVEVWERSFPKKSVERTGGGWRKRRWGRGERTTMRARNRTWERHHMKYEVDESDVMVEVWQGENSAGRQKYLGKVYPQSNRGPQQI